MSPKNPFHHLLFEACYEVILLWRSRRKLHCIQVTGCEIPFFQLTSISECDSTIQKCFIDMESDDEAALYFIHTKVLN